MCIRDRVGFFPAKHSILLSRESARASSCTSRLSCPAMCAGVTARTKAMPAARPAMPVSYTHLVSLRGQSKSVGEVRVSQITATVDISGLTEANEYDLPVTVSVSKSGVETNYVNPGKVHVRVDRVESKDVPVEVNVTGTPDDGYRAGKPLSLIHIYGGWTLRK